MHDGSPGSEAPAELDAMLCKARTACVQAASAAVEVHNTTMVCPAAAASCSFSFRSGAPRFISFKELLAPSAVPLTPALIGACHAAASCLAGSSIAAWGAA